MGPDAHRHALRRRRALPALPGDRARHGRRGAAPGAGLRRGDDLPPERGALGAAHACSCWSGSSTGGSTFEVDDADLEAVRQRCIFTTHTPVPAGHDKFPIDMVRHVLGDERVALLEGCGGVHEGHAQHDAPRAAASRDSSTAWRCGTATCRSGMFPEYPINSITNGVHAATWTAPAFARAVRPAHPRVAARQPLPALRRRHPARRRSARRTRRASARCSTRSRAAPGSSSTRTVFTIGFARRATPYKRADLIFSDLDRLAQIARTVGTAPDRVRRQGAPARRRRQGADPAHPRARASGSATR